MPVRAAATVGHAAPAVEPGKAGSLGRPAAAQQPTTDAGVRRTDFSFRGQEAHHLVLSGTAKTEIAALTQSQAAVLNGGDVEVVPGLVQAGECVRQVESPAALPADEVIAGPESDWRISRPLSTNFLTVSAISKSTSSLNSVRSQSSTR